MEANSSISTTNAHQSISVDDGLVLPWNLLEWTSAENLVVWVRAAVDSLAWDNAEVVQVLAANPSYRPRELLYLLAYSFATGEFDADEVLEKCQTDPNYRCLTSNWTPSRRETIIRFRRENRGLLRWCLLQVLKNATKAHLGEPRLPVGIKRQLHKAATARLDIGRQLDRDGWDS